MTQTSSWSKANRQARRPADCYHQDQTWRWRESNPRPPSLQQDFSGRSVQCLYSAPPVTHTSRGGKPSRCEMSRQYPRPALKVSHLADASIRGGDEPGLTESLRYLGSESELSAI